MRIPAEPPVGCLIAYEYLWLSKGGGRDDGEKVYPVAVILARHDLGPAPVANALGMSHKPPRADERAPEVPRKLKRWLGLDEMPSWVYTDQVKIFVWPGPDIRPANWLSTLPSARWTCVIGPLPSDWFETLVRHVEHSHRTRALSSIRRSK